MQPPSNTKTERLILRQPIYGDAKLIFEQYACDLEVTKYLSWQPHKSIAQTNEYIDRCILAWKNKSAFPFVLIRQNDGRLIGMVEIRIDDRKADLGYVLSKSAWGRGYMPEAVKALVDWSFKQAKIYRVWAVCDIDNIASTRVMEKVGMEREGVLKKWLVHPNISSEPRDCYCYAITSI